MNLSTKQKETHRLKEQTCGCQGGGGFELFSEVVTFFNYWCGTDISC